LSFHDILFRDQAAIGNDGNYLYRSKGYNIQRRKTDTGLKVSCSKVAYTEKERMLSELRPIQLFDVDELNKLLAAPKDLYIDKGPLPPPLDLPGAYSI
jgi:hypothetical protein